MSWLSSALKKSQKKGTGFFSWGESSWFQAFTQNIPVPGLGTGLSGFFGSIFTKGKKGSKVDIIEVKKL